MSKSRRSTSPREQRAPASKLDKFDLYELAVTSPQPLARFLEAVHGGSPKTLGEDFSGTAALSRAWVSVNPRHQAIAVDQNASVVARLSEACANLPNQTCLKIVHANVLHANDPCDILACTNFPICYWHSRKNLLAYLRHAKSRLNRRGILVADLYGGSDAFQAGSKSVTLKKDGTTIKYTWEQRTANALTSRVQNAIHFQVGARVIRNAFAYDWRLWSIPELSEAMEETGFRKVEVYDELGGALDHRGNLVTRPAQDLSDPYVVYVVARK